MASTITRKDMGGSLPDVESTTNLPGLEAEVTVVRDQYGIPHIQAASASDAFFAQGFATAQDRLWHMDYDRRRAYGRWAEYAGSQAVDQDTLMRRFRLEASARADYQVLAPDTHQMLMAYAGGVNAFINGTSRLPVEYRLLEAHPEPWEPWDSLAVFKLRHIMMGVFEQKLWRARLLRQLGPEKTSLLYPGYPKGHLVILPPGEEYGGPVVEGSSLLQQGASWIEALGGADAGSNNWVLDGSRTASGKPIVAGDPHRPLDTPNVYYQNHLACPDFDVVGLSFPGVPGFPHFGHNASVAWCVTHTGADYQDLYIERFSYNGKLAYQFKGEWLPADVFHETIAVRNAEPVELDVTVTHHGQVIDGDPAGGYGLAFRYTATAHAQPWADAILAMVQAQSADDLEEAMRPWVDPVNSFVFADCKGNIGFLTRGQVPMRSEANHWIPVPGWTGEHEWQGNIPFEEMPRLRNPASGYLVTANNRVAPESYPHYIGLEYAPGFRARRVTDRLLELDKATVADMERVHSDKVSVPARHLITLLRGIQPGNALCRRALDYLLQWDGEMSPDSPAATIYSAFRDRLTQRLLEPFLGPLAAEAFSGAGRGAPAHISRVRARLHQMVEENDRSLLPDGFEWPQLIAPAFAEAIEKLGREMGEDVSDWTWGKVHHTQPQHPLSDSFPHVASLLDPPSVPMGGDGETLQAGSYALSDPYIMTSMSVARYVFDLGDWDTSTWVVPLGSSGHPASPHYADQTPLWQQVRMLPMLYSWDRVLADAESQQTLLPGWPQPH